MRLLFTFLVMLGSQFLLAQNPIDFSTLVNRTHAERTYLLNDYYQSGINDFDSLEVVSHALEVERLAALHHDDDLKYEADVIRCHYLANSPTVGEQQFIKECKRLVKLGEADGVVWPQVRAHSLLGHYYLNRMREYALGLFHLTKAARLMDGLDAHDYPLKYLCNYHVALWQYKFDDTNEALLSFKSAINPDPDDPFNEYNLGTLTAIGIIYRNMDQLDSADHYFKRTLELSLRLKNEAWEGISKGNLGENCYLRGEFDEAIDLLGWDAEVGVKHSDWALASNAYNLMGNIALKRDQVKTAREYLEKALDCVKRSNDYSRFAYVYPSLAKLAGKEGNTDLAAAYIDTTIMVNDSLKRMKSQLLSTRAQQQVEMEQIEVKTTKLESEKKRQVLIRNSVIGALVLLGIVLGLLFNRHRLKQQMQRERLMEEKRMAETQLKLAKTELKEFVSSMQVRNMEAATVRAELQQSSILTEEDWQNFKKLFEKVFPGFFGRLNEKVPGLSPAETRFVALGKLELTPNEMAAMLGVGDNAIRQYRIRLRKKMDFDSKEELEAIIRSI